MSGYLYFDRTGHKEVDAILAAIERAGDGFHHTSAWDEPVLDGKSYLDLIDEKVKEAKAALSELNRSHIVDATYNAIDIEGSQKALCDLIGISQTALSLFLTGDRNPPYALLAYLGYGQKTVYYKLGDK